MVNSVKLWQPFSMLRGFEDLFEGLDNFSAEKTARFPRADIAETDKGYEITLEVPGIDRKDLTLEINEDLLSVKGEKRSEETGEGKSYLATERSYGAFHRRFRLPDNADRKSIKADYKNGVLKVGVPKADARESKSLRIEVR